MLAECGKLKTTNYQGKQGEKETLTLGFNSSNSISQCQNYHSKRGSTGLFGLHEAL
jgi:hypothetical protein